MMKPNHNRRVPFSSSRRTFLGQSLALGAAALPTIVSARALGLEAGTAAASERITLGVIGIGNRCRYANGVVLFLDFLATPFGDRAPNWNTKLGTCPVKFIGKTDWVETGDSGGIDLSDEALRTGLPPQEKVPKGTDAALHAQNFFDSVKSRQPTICNADVMRKSHIACHAAAIVWMLGRKLAFDPAREVFTTPDGLDAEANSLRSRPERDCWA